ncbi:DUF2800 domain-containing protein [Patescibacteria group bacterium]|nr:DUF2800 domain-containing protein [Patescibacteria group bacterium]
MNAALDGTITHALLEHCIKGNLVDPMTLIGQTFTYEHEHDPHATLSPSKRHRWAVCVGSIREERRIPEAVETKTKVDYTVDQDRAERVKVAIDYIRTQIHGYGKAFNVIAEQRVDPAPLVGRDDLYGTVDCQLWYGDTYEIIDYKDGMSEVKVEGNHQLEQYAVGVLAKGDILPAFDKVRLTIIQPKMALKGQPPIASVTVPRAEVETWAAKLAAEAAATDDLNAPLTPGESQCGYCRAKGTCPALAGKVMEELGVMFQPVNAIVPAPEIAHQLGNREPTLLTPDQMRQVLEAAPLVRDFLAGVEAEAQRRMEAGQTVPGFKLVRGRGSNSWALPEAEIAEKLRGMKVPEGSIFSASLVSPAQAKKLQWTNRKGEVQKLTDRQVKTLETEYITHASGKLTVVPESDNREAVIFDAADLFATVAPSLPVFAAPASDLAIPAWLS